jgi:hypothetical protein
MQRAAILIFAACLLSPSMPAQTCANIRTFDFRNATIHIAVHDTDGKTSVSESKDDSAESIRLHDGAGFSSDGEAGAHDWRITSIENHLLHPDAKTWVRVIVLDKNHLTGTGDWRYIMAFTCADGSLVRLFQYGSEGVSLKHVEDRALVLYQAVWGSEDAHAEPSEHRELAYRWSATDHRYHPDLVMPANGNP